MEKEKIKFRNVVFRVPENCTECGNFRRSGQRFRCAGRYEDEGQEIPPEGLKERPIPFCPIDGVLVEGGEIIPILAYEIMRILKGENNGSERWHAQILFDGDAPPQEVEETLKEYRRKYPTDTFEPQFGKLCDFIYTDFMYPNSFELKAICSRCRHVFCGEKGRTNDLSTYNYCPNCGAKIGTRKK